MHAFAPAWVPTDTTYGVSVVALTQYVHHHLNQAFGSGVACASRTKQTADGCPEPFVLNVLLNEVGCHKSGRAHERCPAGVPKGARGHASAWGGIAGCR